MNRFRTRRYKTKLDINVSHEPDSPTTTSSPFRMFARKKSIEEARTEIDISNALPSTDDFRTSLLMTGLSARFSMLREQDDPTTKIGKASDDSVLFPNRQSRLHDFGFGDLSNIAEVDSIREVAPYARMDSYCSSDDGGSIMSRPKPTEGNVLFGGRQKIYKIPSSGSGKGKPLYENDVPLSSFQRWRLQEREASLSQLEGSEILDKNSAVEAGDARSRSPSLSSSSRSYDALSASSSLMPNPTLISDQTAPMMRTLPPSSSPASFERNSSVARTRRLYEQGLNQELNEQQSSAKSRVETLTRKFTSKSPELFQDSNTLLERRLLTKASAPSLYTPPLSSTAEKPPPFPPSIATARAISPMPSPASSTVVESDKKPSPTPSPALATESIASPASVIPSVPSPTTAPPPIPTSSRQSSQSASSHANRDGVVPLSRTESAESHATTNSRASAHSASSSRGLPLGQKTPPQSGRTDAGFRSFLNLDVQSSPESPSRFITILPTGLARPADEDHPAFRDSPPTTALFLDNGLGGPGSFSTTMPDASDNNVSPPNAHLSPSDAFLASRGTGLSGMVRQHLRAGSSASSIYDTAPEPLSSPPSIHWPSSSATITPSLSQLTESKISPPSPPTGSPTQLTPDSEKEEQDMFAKELADGARRIRERLTSYVESDSRPGSSLSSHVDLDDPLPPPPPRGNPLGILKPKSSLSSLMERARESASSSNNSGGSQMRPLKLLGLATAAMSNSNLDKASPEERDGHAIPEPKTAAVAAPTTSMDALRQFRQARKELQRVTDSESAGTGPGLEGTRSPMSPPGSRSASQARDRSGSNESQQSNKPRHPALQVRCDAPLKGQLGAGIPLSATSRSPAFSGRLPSSHDAAHTGRSSPISPHSGALQFSAPMSPPPVGAPPPVPPINPRRRDFSDSRRSDLAFSVSPVSPALSFASESRAAFPDGDSIRHRPLLRKMVSEAGGMNMRSGASTSKIYSNAL